jgi:OOP family OmpA-OmpF porin
MRSRQPITEENTMNRHTQQIRTQALTAALMLGMTLGGTAARAQDSGWYAGASIGTGTTEVRTGALRAALQTAGYAATTMNSDERDIAFKLVGGYAFNETFALEGAYADPGAYAFRSTLVPAASARGEADLRTMALTLVARWSPRDRVAAFVRAGLAHARIEQDFIGTVSSGAFADRKDKGIHATYGAGLEYTLDANWSLRAELERQRIDGNRITADRVDVFSVGFLYRFGRKSAVVMAPAEPPPTPAPAPALSLTATLSASTLFDFDRAELKPEGRAALDKLVSDMADLNYEVVIVTGHTDRIGTRTYNLALSQRRADTVKNYLSAAGIAVERITTRGVNSDEPVTRPGQCTGPVSDALKACLQPDRRVVVEVTGEREP